MSKAGPGFSSSFSNSASPSSSSSSVTFSLHPLDDGSFTSILSFNSSFSMSMIARLVAKKGLP
ncbi:hypothetical protein A2U01_0061435, partial [Trifolium medium]|nr:hypothetical protein [Trifolium medium]